MTYRDRYRQAYLAYTARETPTFYEMSGGDNMKVTIPNVGKSNGLTKFITNYLTWQGHRATRINSTGRLIDGQQRQESGAILTVKKWIPGTTRRGTADVSSTIRGRSVMFEVKVGRDRPSEYQLKEQELERKAGGEYFFTHDPDEFFAQYDSLFVS
jgi:hypothetical protein